MSYGVRASADIVQASMKVAEGTLFTDSEADAIGEVIASIEQGFASDHQARAFKKELLRRGRAGRIDRTNLRHVLRHARRQPFWGDASFPRLDNTPQYYADCFECVLHVARVSGLSEDEALFAGRMVDNMARRMGSRWNVRDFQDIVESKVHWGQISPYDLDAIRPYCRTL